MKKYDIDEMYPRESFPVTTPIPRERQTLPGTLTRAMRLPNLNDWSKEQELIWAKKDLVEVESYYLNTHNNIKKMKKSPKGKPSILIAKKKEWRQGLGQLLVTAVKGYTLVHTPRETSTSVLTSATNGLTMLKNNNETATTIPISNVSVKPVHGSTLGIRRTKPMPKAQNTEESEDWHIDYKDNN